MAKIPEIQRSKLASQVVGTPGVDSSAAAVFGAVAQAGLEQKQRTARIQSTNDEMESNLQMIQFDRDLKKAAKQNLNFDEYSKLTEELFTERLGNIKSEGAKSRFSTQGSRRILGRNDSAERTLDKNNMRKLKFTLDTTGKELAAGVSEIFSDPDATIVEQMDELINATQLLEDTIFKSKAALSPEALEAYKDGVVELMVASAVNGLLDSNPEEIDAFLDSDIIKDLVPNTDQIKKDAIGIAKRNLQLKQLGLLSSQNTSGQELSKLVGAGKITLTEMFEGVLSGRFSRKDVAAAEKIMKSSKNVWSGNNPQTVEALNIAFSAIGKKTKSTDKKQFKEDKKKLSFEQVIAFRQRVMEARASGNLDAPTYRMYLRRTEMFANEGIEDLIDDINKKMVPLSLVDVAFDPFNFQFISDLTGGFFPPPGVRSESGVLEKEVTAITDKGELADAKVAFITGLMDRIDKQEDKSMASGGGRLSNEDVLKITRNFKRDFFIQRGSDRSKWQLGNVVNLDGRFFKVVGFNDAEQAILDDDLQAPVDKIAEDK